MIYAAILVISSLITLFSSFLFVLLFGLVVLCLVVYLFLLLSGRGKLVVKSGWFSICHCCMCLLFLGFVVLRYAELGVLEASIIRTHYINMRALGWNCRGICNAETVQALRNHIKGHRPKIIFLCETKADEHRMEKIKNMIGFEKKISIEAKGRA